MSFTSAFDDPGTAITGVDTTHCRFQICGIAFAGTAYFAKPLHTVDSYYGYLFPTATAAGGTADGGGEGWDTHDGWLQGCGHGTFVMHQTRLQPTPSPTGGMIRLTLEWTVEDGTGAFAGATGHGTAFADFTTPASPSFPPTGPNSGEYTGTITCPNGD